MDWIPVVFIAFKVLVFGTGMFFAIKWHYERSKKGSKADRSAVLRASGKVAAVFVGLLLVLSLVAFGLGRLLDLDLGLF